MLDNRDAPMDSATAILDEMQTIARAAAEPWAPGDSIKAAIGRASRRTGLGFRRMKTFWYTEPANVSAIEADALRRWYRDWIANERARLQARIADLETEWDRLGSHE